MKLQDSITFIIIIMVFLLGVLLVNQEQRISHLEYMKDRNLEHWEKLLDIIK